MSMMVYKQQWFGRLGTKNRIIFYLKMLEVTQASFCDVQKCATSHTFMLVNTPK